MTAHRNFNKEFNDGVERKYAYSFDFDVMHPYMIESFRPFLFPGSALELGSFKGDFTKRLLSYFKGITCVEASEVAIGEAKKKLGKEVHFIEGTLENLEMTEKFDNVFLTHVLEHVDDAVGVLRRINNEWLSETGRLFLVCPNANAPSRQIAVKMGLISNNTAITHGEAQHGHHRTYTLDTLERDVTAAGLRVVQRSGIFFKALANFQWDKILNTDVISKEYLDGCYALGQIYPDLCASIFLLCEKGK
jgi:2-polyprenyl-3-methyl-5-hydroxy-6-metoxy-1,4-benzoquinol methylase